jgi:hypothetical protein
MKRAPLHNRIFLRCPKENLFLVLTDCRFDGIIATVVNGDIAKW